jgi:hypothetical protein
MSDIPVYDPRGIVAAEARPLAPRVAGLEGLRLGVLDNTKWNANKLLRRMSAALEREHGLASVRYLRKESFSKVAAPAILDELAGNCDVVLTAIGD